MSSVLAAAERDATSNLSSGSEEEGQERDAEHDQQQLGYGSLQHPH